MVHRIDEAFTSSLELNTCIRQYFGSGLFKALLTAAFGEYTVVALFGSCVNNMYLQAINRTDYVEHVADIDLMVTKSTGCAICYETENIKNFCNSLRIPQTATKLGILSTEIDFDSDYGLSVAKLIVSMGGYQVGVDLVFGVISAPNVAFYNDMPRLSVPFWGGFLPTDQTDNEETWVLPNISCELFSTIQCRTIDYEPATIWNSQGQNQGMLLNSYSRLVRHLTKKHSQGWVVEVLSDGVTSIWAPGTPLPVHISFVEIDCMKDISRFRSFYYEMRNEGTLDIKIDDTLTYVFNMTTSIEQLYDELPDWKSWCNRKNISAFAKKISSKQSMVFRTYHPHSTFIIVNNETMVQCILDVFDEIEVGGTCSLNLKDEADPPCPQKHVQFSRTATLGTCVVCMEYKSLLIIKHDGSKCRTEVCAGCFRKNDNKCLNCRHHLINPTI